MELNKYTKHTIFSLPLLFNNRITATELKENQFVNMFVRDKNRPILDCVYLMFKNLKEDLLNKFYDFVDYYNMIPFNYNGINYQIVAFTKDYFDSYIIDSINKGMYQSLNFCDKMKIIKFWYNPKVNDKLFQYLFDNNCDVEKPNDESIDLKQIKP